MKKLINIRSLIGLCFISFALVLLYNQNTNTIDFKVLQLTKPSDMILSVVNPVSKLVSDKHDRAKLAIFNQEFAKRVVTYETDTQQLNDLYVESASCFFNDTLNDKYDGLSDGLTKLLKMVTTEDNSILTDPQKLQLSELLLGLSWTLTQ